MLSFKAWGPSLKLHPLVFQILRYIYNICGLLSMLLPKQQMILLCMSVVELSLQKPLYAAHRHENTMRNLSGSDVSLLEKKLNET